jgi:protein SCO1/2
VIDGPLTGKRREEHAMRRLNKSITHSNRRTLVSRNFTRRGACVLFNLVHTLALVMLIGLRPASAGEAGTVTTAAPEHAGHEHHHHMPAAPGYQRSQATYSVPDVTLLDQHGQRVSLPTLLDSGDKPVMLNFIFTSCTAICPMMTAIFAKVQTQLGGDAGRVRMVSVSIDPEHDTPAELAAYAARFGAGPQWLFLTGSLDDSIAVQHAFDAYRGDKMNHTPLTLFHAAAGSPWVRYDGFADAADLTEEYRGMMAN